MSYNNPFGGDGATNPYGGSEPPVAPRSSQSSTTPSWAAEPSAPTNSKDLDMTAESLRRKEQELIRREQELDNRERMLKQQGVKISNRPPNWPRWPKHLVRQDINGDIQGDDLRSLVRRAFILWHVLCFFLLWNLVAMCGVLAVDGSVGDFVLAIVYFVLWLPITFLNYRTLYNAARTGKALRYFFWFFLCWILNSGLHILGAGREALWYGGIFVDDFLVFKT